MSRKIYLVELNYQITPLSIREKISSEYDHIQQELSNRLEGGVFIISTCHRFSILSFTESPEVILEYLQSSFPYLLKKHLFISSDKSAIQHFFSTAAGLKSRTVGEHEILGQVRKAFSSSLNISPELNEIVKRSIFTGKRARTETYIGRHSTSLAAITGERIKQHFNDTKDITILLFGTGEMARLILNMLKWLEVKEIKVISKDLERARAFCKEQYISAVAIENLTDEIRNSQVLIGATQTPDHLFSIPEQFNETGEKLLIDLGMPRNFDPNLDQLDNMHLYDLDNINQTLDDSKRKRCQEMTMVNDIIEEEVTAYMEWLDFRQYVPKIKKLKKDLALLKTNYLQRVSNFLFLNEVDKEQLTIQINGIVQDHFSQIIRMYRAQVDENRLTYIEQKILTELGHSIQLVLRKYDRVAA